MTAMTNAARNRQHNAAGFTLLELMVSIFILTIMLGVVFQQVDMVQRRSRSEASRLDAFQQARDLMDLVGRDIHGSGYPNSRIVDATQIPNGINDPKNNIGLVKADVGELRLESYDQQGNVVEVVYQLNGTTLNRGQAQKLNGNPLTGQVVTLSPVVERVQTATFTAYRTDGTAVTLPADISTAAGAVALAQIKSIEVVLQVQGPVPDMQTGVYPSTTLRSVVRVINCSQAAAGQTNSCS